MSAPNQQPQTSLRDALRNFSLRGFRLLLSDHMKERTESVVLWVAIASYLIHLGLIFLNTQGLLGIDDNFLKSPIAAIYTPFSIILLYEVYLLIYYIPKSITIYIGKQYEIITLIIIRRIFKDIAYVELTSDWFRDQNDLQFTFDVVTSLLLFLLIFVFYLNIKKRQYVAIKGKKEISDNVRKFVTLKQILATLLVPVFLVLSIYAITNWAIVTYQDYTEGILTFKKINTVFYDDFFTALIIVDVLLLLFSFFYSNKFYKIIRNSGFVISTILIKISFQATGIVNNVLVTAAVSLGCLFLIIHNMYQRKEKVEELSSIG
ncbi:MAG: hypothetical protein AAF597_00460 [Bacteroidota bacterium]